VPRQNWSRPLPRPLTIPEVMDLITLADVRKLLGHLPKQTREKSTWQHVAAELAEAAKGADPANVAVALRMVLSLEGVECRVKDQR
jgi:hypothetical protein